MKNLTIILSILVFSFCSSQIKIEKLGRVTKEIVKLYLQDTIKSQFKSEDYISISIFLDTKSQKSNLYIETVEKEFPIFKNTDYYRWFIFQGKKVIVFCDLGSNDKCEKYFESLNFIKDKENKIELLNEKNISTELDGSIKLWEVTINEKNKINEINGKIIEAEIENPKEFKKILRKHSVLRLYQLIEGGHIISPPIR